MPDTHKHAINNAKAWLETIVSGMAAYTALQTEEVESVTFDGETFEDEDSLRERLEEGPLSVRVRNGWYAPGSGADAEPEEFEILLSTGGPALRIIGEMGMWSRPERPVLQWQDWGTPWTDHDLTRAEAEALEAYCGLFYFGE